MPTEFVVHFKSLLPGPITATTNRFIERQLSALRALLEPGLTVRLGTIENLGENAALQPLQDLDVGQCSDGITEEQTELFKNRNNATANDVIFYIVHTLVGEAPNGEAATFLGCANYPVGQPGAAITRADDVDYLAAHELAHCCKLLHVDDNRNLMFRRTTWTKVPPELSDLQRLEMRTSVLV